MTKIVNGGDENSGDENGGYAETMVTKLLVKKTVDTYLGLIV